MPVMWSGRATCFPSTTTEPVVGGQRPVTTFINVDLPQPEGPTTATNSPRSTFSEASCSASVPSPSSPNRNETLLSSTKLFTAYLQNYSKQAFLASSVGLVRCWFREALGFASASARCCHPIF